jgi:hypothetical protein
MNHKTSLPLQPLEKTQTTDANKRRKLSLQPTPIFKHNLFRASALTKKDESHSSESPASKIEEEMCNEDEEGEEVEEDYDDDEGEEEEEDDYEEEEEEDDDDEVEVGSKDRERDDSDVETSRASDEEYELRDEFCSFNSKSASSRKKVRCVRKNKNPGVWTARQSSRQTERRKARMKRIENESWFLKGDSGYPKLTQYLPSVPKKFGGLTVTCPSAPEEGRTDLPQDSEEFQKWLASRHHRSRPRLAHGWRKSLGFRSKCGESLSGYRFVFQTSAVSQQGGQWQARVSIKGQKHYVGVFMDPENAARAADRKAVELGMWPHELNFPEDFDRHKAILAKRKRGSEVDDGRANVFKSLELTDGVSAEGTSTPPLKTSELCNMTQGSESEEEDFVKPSVLYGGNAAAPIGMCGYRSVFKESLTTFNVRFKFRGHEYKLGGFKSAIEAARAYDAKIVATGKAAENIGFLNFPDEWTSEQIHQPKVKKQGQSKRKKSVSVEHILEYSGAQPPTENEFAKQLSSRPLRACRAREVSRSHANFSKESKRQRARTKIVCHASAFRSLLVADSNDSMDKSDSQDSNISNINNNSNGSKKQRAYKAVKIHVSAFHSLLQQSSMLLPLRVQMVKQSNE